ncbi:MAG TPA: hypothetical protein VFD71_02070 [Planctomycetota bacterium]|nr:hypothetical protein [Planctomycetota bacterium]
MRNRRAFLSLLVAATAAIGAAHAGARIAPTRESVTTPRTAPTRMSWASVLAAYQSVMGVTLSQLPGLSAPLEILGVRDGPDGVDGLGAKGFKGLTPKYTEEEELPPPPPSSSE